MHAAAATTWTELQRAVAALVFITILWGVSFPLVKINNLLMTRNQLAALGDLAEQARQVDLDLSAAAVTTTLRFGLSFFVLMVAFPRLFGSLTLRQWSMGAIIGVVFAIALLLQIIALNEIPASRSGFLTSLTVVFTPLMMIVVNRRHPALQVILAAELAVVGVAILTEAYTFDLTGLLQVSDEFTQKFGTGDVLTILAAAVFAVEIILIDMFSRRMPPALLTPGMFLATMATGAVVFVVHQFTWAEAPPLSSWTTLFATPAFPLLSLVICVVCTLVPFHLMNKYQAKVTPNQAALIYTLEPVFTVACALTLPGLLAPHFKVEYPSEKLSVALVGGGGLVIAANVLGFWSTPEPGKGEVKPVFHGE